jgi:hypothetical protein
MSLPAVQVDRVMGSFKSDPDLLHFYVRSLAWTQKWSKLREVLDETQYDLAHHRHSDTGRTVVQDVLLEFAEQKDSDEMPDETMREADVVRIVNTLVGVFGAKLDAASIVLAERIGIRDQLVQVPTAIVTDAPLPQSPTPLPPKSHARYRPTKNALLFLGGTVVGAVAALAALAVCRAQGLHRLQARPSF